jgi:hypothetical protein
MYNTLSRPTGKTYFAFIIRSEDSAIFNYQTQEFIVGQKLHLTLDELSRSKFRCPYEEIRPGAYRLFVDSTLFQDGTYTILTRELRPGGEEGLPEDTIEVELLSGEQLDTSLNLQIKTVSGLSLFCFIKDRYSSNYFNSATQEFQRLDPTDEVEEFRAPFRLSFTEQPSGVYTINRSLSNFPDGNYEVTTYQLVDYIEYRVGKPIVLKVHDGRQQRGVLFNTVMVNHDTNLPDNYRYIKPNGEPVNNAQVVIYIKSDYLQDEFTNPIGTTVTLPDGRWADPIPVQAGDTYVVKLHAPGVAGPDFVDLVV